MKGFVLMFIFVAGCSLIFVIDAMLKKLLERERGYKSDKAKK